MRKAKRYDRNTHDPTAGLCYPWIFLLALTHLTLVSYRSSRSFHSREERRRSVTRGMGWEKEGAMSGWRERTGSHHSSRRFLSPAHTSLLSLLLSLGALYVHPSLRTEWVRSEGRKERVTTRTTGVTEGWAEWKEIREEKWQRGTGDVVSWEVKEHYHKDNLRHLPRFPGFFVTFRILVTSLYILLSCRVPRGGWVVGG